MTPVKCRRCDGNGLAQTAESDGLRLDICPDCQGAKALIPAPECRTLLGTCIHCSQEVHLISASPCPSAENHVVPAPDFPSEESNG